MTDAATAGTELSVLPERADIPALFTEENGIESVVAKIEDEVRKVHIDVSTAKGRKAAKSLASKVSRSKTLIDEVGKEQNEERNRLNKEVNAKRNLAKERLDALRDEVRAPVEQWEREESERVKKHQVALGLFDIDQLTALNSSDELQSLINRINQTEVDDSWEEFEAEAREAQAVAIAKYRADYDVAKDREDKEAELAELRAKEAKRQQEDEEREAIERAAKEEAERKDREEKAAQEAVERAKKEAEEKHQQELAAAKEREEQAAKAERDRIEREQAEREAAEQKRKEDAEHRRKIRKEVIDAITAAKPANWEEVVDAMIAGEIPHVKVQF